MVQAEQSVIGCLMMAPELLDKAAPRCFPRDV